MSVNLTLTGLDSLLHHMMRSVQSITASPEGQSRGEEETNSDPVNDEVIVYVYTIVLGFLCGLISLFGIVTNVINITVFARQGFQETINISLMALAVSDICSLVALLFVSVCFTPFFMYSSLPLIAIEVQQFTGGWTHIVFTRITGLITVFITVERCLCIAYPLKVKVMLPPQRVKIIVVAIFAVVFGLSFPNYFGTMVGWKFVPELNRTMLGNVPTKYSAQIFKYATITQPFYPVLSFPTVVVCTYVLISKLNQRSKWRQATTASGVGGSAASTSGDNKSMVRDRQVVKMVTCVAVIFIISYTPSLALFIVMLIVPGFFHGLKFENSFSVTLSISFVFEGINSAVNIFVYLKTNSKYRAQFKSMFSQPLEKSRPTCI